MSNPRVVGIVLAAGVGRRMGRLKQALPFRGKTILESVIDNALASALDAVIVVLGYQAESVEPLLKSKDVVVTVNADYARGQSSSLKAGLKLVSDDVNAVLFLLGDQPLISAEVINQILSASAVSDHSIAYPVHLGRRGNPVLFKRATFEKIMSLTGDSGARPLLKEYAGRILEVPVSDSAIHLDIDTEEEYRCLMLAEGKT